MSIDFDCPCGRPLTANDEFAGRPVTCPGCGRLLTIPRRQAPQNVQPLDVVPDRPAAAAPPVTPPPPVDEAVEIVDFMPPPVVPPSPRAPAKPVVQRMLEALLDPRAIHWMLGIGGGLAVLGLVVWLVSLGVFDDPRIIAAFLGLGSLGILGGGWAVTLKTRYATAGRALTFLGCVVAPLNLWFYHAQKLVTLDQGLWVGGVVCVLLYMATVYVLRDPLFMYAVEAGVTLTVVLLLGDLGWVTDVARLSLALIVLAAISLHAEWAFAESGDFPRARYGLPLFDAGHAQLFAALLFVGPYYLLWGGASANLVGAVWLLGAYLYLYSHLLNRRALPFAALAALCLLIGESVLLVPHLQTAGLLAALALTGVLLQGVAAWSASELELRRNLSTLAAVVAACALLIGLSLFWSAHSPVLTLLGLQATQGLPLIVALVIASACSRASAALVERISAKIAEWYFYFSGGALLMAAASLLQLLGLDWPTQACVLMLLPIAYITAAGLWAGHSPATPLARTAHAAAIVIVGCTALAALERDLPALWQNRPGDAFHLLLALAFAEATLFYLLAAWFRGQTWNAGLATAAACGALWQLLSYAGLPGAYFPPVFAVLGLVIQFAYGVLAAESVRWRKPWHDSGNAVTFLALTAGGVRGLARLTGDVTWQEPLVLVLLGVVALFAAAVATPEQRRGFLALAVALGALAVVTLNALLLLEWWRKMELLAVVVGLLVLAASHAGRFQETDESTHEAVSAGLWLGSVLTLGPLFLAMLHYRFFTTAPSLGDELVLLTVATLALVTGCSWQLKATTLLGGAALATYLVILVGSLLYRPEATIGVYLLIGGGLLFVAGVLLSIYRDRLLALPERLAHREGLFRVIDWR